MGGPKEGILTSEIFVRSDTTFFDTSSTRMPAAKTIARIMADSYNFWPEAREVIPDTQEGWNILIS